MEELKQGRCGKASKGVFEPIKALDYLVEVADSSRHKMGTMASQHLGGVSEQLMPFFYKLIGILSEGF